MSARMLMASIAYWLFFFFWKLLAKPKAATSSMMRYWMMVTELSAQKEPSSGATSVKLHCSMLTAYFWKGKMAE